MSNAVHLGRVATYADLEALSPKLKGEIIDGELYTQARPRPKHALAASIIGRRVGRSYGDGEDGPGGWWILVEPGAELPGAPEVAPDVGGWRRERMPALPDDASISLVPDWVCEVLSPSNRTYDQRVKFPFYARVGVAWLWVVDPAAKLVQVRQLVNEHWSEIAVFADDETMCAEPFSAVRIRLPDLWG